MAAKVKANLELNAQNNTDKAFRQVNESLRNTARTLQVVQGPLGPVAGRFTALSSALGSVSVSGLALTAAFTGSVFAFKKGAEVFADTEKQLLQLEAQLNATGNSAGKSSQELEDLAQNVARATLASLEEVRTAEGILLSFRSITEDTFDRSLVAAQDLAAAGFGSITDAAKQLGKALEDPATGLSSLRRAGVTFSETQKSLVEGFIDAGDKASAMSLILEGIESQVGGAGAAQGKGLAGSFDSLTQSVENFWAALGKQTAASGFGGVIDYLSEKIQQIADDMLTIEGLSLDRLSSQYDNLNRQVTELADSIAANEEKLATAGFFRSKVLEGQIAADKEHLGILQQRLSLAERELQTRQKEEDVATRQGEISQEELARQEAIARAKKQRAEAEKAALKRSQELAKWHRDILNNFVKEQRALDQISARLDPIGALTHQYLKDREAILGIVGQEATKQAYLNALTAEYTENLQAAKDEMSALSKEEQEVYNNAEAIGNILGDGFKAATLEGEKFADVMNDVLSRVASKLLDILIIENLVQGFAGAATSLFSSSTGGAAPIVDQGTQYVPQKNIGGPAEGRTLIGEAGPEILHFPKYMNLDPVIIGDKGPEILDLPKGSYIEPNQKLKELERSNDGTMDLDRLLSNLAPPVDASSTEGRGQQTQIVAAPDNVIPFPGNEAKDKSDEQKIAVIMSKHSPAKSSTGSKPYVDNANTGGQVSGPTLVGETGPEIVDFPSNSYVTPNRDVGAKKETSVIVNVINNAEPAVIDVDEKSQPDGNTLITVVLNKVAESVSNNGIVGRSIQQTFGTRQRVITR